MKSPPSMLSPIESPRRMIEAVQKKQLINKCCIDVVAMQDSVSQLSLCVNDSAGNTTFDETYEKQQLLGQGGFADVFRCRHRKRGTTYAVKEVYDDNYENFADNIREEVNAMKRLREGCYIVRLLDVFRESDRTFLIMEEMRGGDLLERLYETVIFTEPDAKRLSRKLLEAVRYCHKKNIAHRDIKPENILLTHPSNNTDIRLADFGCAKFMTEPNCLRTLCGSTQYCAPELYTHTDGYNEKCDNWSIGIVIYILLGGYAPFDGDDEDIPDIVCAGSFKFHADYWDHVSEEPKDVIRSLLQVDPNDRATLEETLDSEWLRRRDVESLTVEGSSTTFDAWVRRQNESSQSISLDSSYGRSTYKIDTSRISQGLEQGTSNQEEEEDYDDRSECSLSIGDLR